MALISLNNLERFFNNLKTYISNALNSKANTSHTHTKSEITDFPSLATVATSGSYNDLSNKPTIPTVNNATLTIQKNGTTVKTFTANASSNVTANITVPTKTSDLTNDSGFLTSHQDLSGYIPKSGGAVLDGQTFMRTVDNSTLNVYGGNGYGHGAFLQLTGKDEIGSGDFNIQAHDGTNAKVLKGKANGTLTWEDKEIDTIEEQGNNYIRYSSGLQICWGGNGKTTENDLTLNFPKAFSQHVYSIGVVVSGQSPNIFAGGWDKAWVKIVNTNQGGFSYTAIGKWK